MGLALTFQIPDEVVAIKRKIKLGAVPEESENYNNFSFTNCKESMDYLERFCKTDHFRKDLSI